MLPAEGNYCVENKGNIVFCKITSPPGPLSVDGEGELKGVRSGFKPSLERHLIERDFLKHDIFSPLVGEIRVRGFNELSPSPCPLPSRERKNLDSCFGNYG
jgi:hypothetical protein